ncbi:MAG: molybdopterin-dependent oxidoreductase [Bacteroidetes bacterium]|nr:molybdopterin-dependent oxidoreductase [Bacteroidota bacterium]
MMISRRDFLKGVGAAGALAALGSVASRYGIAAEEQVVPHLTPTVCGMCTAHCGVLAYTAEGKLLKLEGNFKHSHSQGRICARGSAGVKLLYDPDRLKTPLKRNAAGDFEPISWEQAWQEIGQKLQELRQREGPQILAWARQPNLSDLWDRQFVAAFGSPNLFSNLSMARGSRNLACRLTLGGVPVSDLGNARYLLVFGRNFGESIFVSDLEALMRAKERGAHVVVVDPRLSNTAAQAHEWISIRPGTDGAMILAIMNVIVEEGLLDTAYVAKNTVGFPELKAYLADKTPAWAASVCDVPADTIRRVAREFARARPACGVDPGWHSAWGALYANSVQTARAALALNALVGSFGAQGGLLMPAQPPLGEFKPPATPPVKAIRADAPAGGEFPLADPTEGRLSALPEIILSEKPYPIRALVCNHLNPALSLPEAGKVEEALRKLDLLVVIDVQMSETAQLAHYVLPETTYLERFDPLAISTRLVPEAALRQPVVAPMYEARPAYEIITGLARATGLGDYFAFNVSQVINAQAAGLGTTLEQMLREGVWQGKNSDGLHFETPSGKIELYSERLKQAGLEPLPMYEAPAVRPSGIRSFRLIHGRDAAHTGTSTQNNAWLQNQRPENELWINAARAARLSISSGDWVQVSSDVGSVRVKARATETIHPEAVYLAHGFGHKVRQQRLSFGKGVNDNVLIADRSEPLAGGAALNETLVQVRPAD